MALAPSDRWWQTVRVSEDFWNGAPVNRLHGAPVQTYYGKPEAQARPIIAAAREASRRTEPPKESFWSGKGPSLQLHSSWTTAGPLRPIIHARRSAQSYDPDGGPKNGLPTHIFYGVLRRLMHQPVWFPWRATVQPFLFVHRVEGIQPGIYMLCRGLDGDEGQLRKRIDPDGHFDWQSVPDVPDDVPLVLVRRGDVREEAKLGSCVQDIASDSAFAVVFMAEHLPALAQHGAWWYKRAHWEACALGGALYLAAGAAGAKAGLQSTGIGCFFAPWVHALLNVDPLRWADVYHFTLGWPNIDRRLDLAVAPYDHADAMRGRDRDTVSSRGA
eukprot:gnl/TRDRNA2_/TRDRNA2_127498_c2_seq1.p1 gnl/TRDRNA2_/TRDRNA2_127498_c2~~gnl/TRDRNA2_/TRDRNA2_127498_c2_seq1.p1  ORF type:complete len:361 (+),score=34.37 gnl/TRDRNA2_/TRDRNA2_127498_c2_seq1:99-1085(+)